MILLILWCLVIVEKCSYVDCTVRDKLRKMEEDMNDKLEKYKLDLKSLFEEYPPLEEPRSSRKSDDETWSYFFAGPEEVPNRIVVKALPSSYDVVEDVNFLLDINFGGSTYFLKGTSRGNLVLLSNNLSSIITSLNLSATPYKAQSFEYEGSPWLVVLCSTNNERQHFVTVYKIDLDRKLMELKQNITCDGLSDIKLITLDNGYGEANYLVMSTYSRRFGGAQSVHASTILFKWDYVQFDNVVQISTEGAISVDAWIMDNRLHVIVAQEKNDANLTVPSPVFTYNAYQSRLILIEYIQTIMPKKVKYMRIRDNEYAVFLSEEGLSIYWWTGHGFTEWKNLKIPEAIDMDVVHLQGEAIIAVASKNIVTFYTKFAQTIVKAGDLQVEELITKASFFDQGSIQIIITTENGISGVFSIEVNVTSYDGVMDDIDPLLSCLVELRSATVSRARHIEYMFQNVQRVWRYDQDQKVATEIIVEEVNVLNVTTVEKLQLFPIKDKDPTFDYDEVITGTSKSLYALKERMENVVYKSADQVITGNLIFLSAVEANVTRINRLLRDTYLNDVSIEKLDKYALKTSGDQIITGNLTLTDLSVENLIVDGTINGLRTEDLFLLYGNQTVSGTITLSDVRVSGNVTVIGPINGIEVGDIVTISHSHQIYGIKTFSALVAKEISVDGFVNGEDLSVIAQKVIPLSSPCSVTGDIFFAAPVSIKNLSLNGFVNGRIDLEKLFKEGVTAKTNQTIHGKKTFNNKVFFSKDVEVEGKWNNIDLQTLITTSTVQTIHGKVVFKKPVYITNNLKTGTVNSIKLKEDAVLLGGQKLVPSKKHFASSLTVRENALLGQNCRINNVVPMDLAKLLDDILRGAPGYNNVTVIGSLTVDVGGLNLSKKSSMQNIQVPVKFLCDVIIDGNLHVNSINSHLIQDFAMTTSDSLIRGKITFMDDIHVASNIVMIDGATMNGFDLSEIAKDIYIEPNTKIKGKKSFISLSLSGNVEVGKVNGIRLPQDVMLRKSQQNITGNLKFKKVVVYGNLVGHNLSVFKMNGWNATNLLKDFVLVDVHAETLSLKTFRSLKVVKDVLADGSIDGVYLKHFLTNAVTLNTHQSLKAKNFTGRLVFEGPLRVKFLNDFCVKNLTKQFVFDNTKIVNGEIIVSGNVTILGSAEVDAINGIDIEELQMHAFSKSKPNFFNKWVVFLRSIEIGSLTVETTIDGVYFRDFIFLNSSHSFDKVEFTKAVTAVDIELLGTVNGCNLTQLSEDAILRNVPWQNIKGMKQIHSLKANKIFVKGKINDVDINSLLSYSHNGWRNIKDGVYHFRNLSASSLYIKHTVNEVNITYLLSDAVWKTGKQVVTGKKIFTNECGIIFESDLRIYGDVNVKGDINEISWKELLETAVTKHGNQSISGMKKFSNVATQCILMNGQLNSVRIPKDVVLASHYDSFGTTTHFDDIEIRGNIVVRGLIDNVSLYKLINERFTLSTKQEVRNTNFLSDVFIMDDLVITGKVNNMDLRGINVSTKVLKSLFTKDLTIIGNLTIDEMNSYNFTSLISAIVTEVMAVTIQGLEVKGLATFNNITSSNSTIIPLLKRTERLNDLSVYLASVLEEWDTLNAVYNKSVLHQLENMKAEYGYFIVVTELSSVPIQRFLPVHSTESSTEVPDAIIAWVLYQMCHNSCCNNYISCTFLPAKNSLDSTKCLNGLYYPLYLPVNLTSSINDSFFIRSEQSKECSLSSTDILTLNISHLMDLSEMESFVSNLFLVPLSPKVESLRTFAFGGNLYLVMASSQAKYPDVNGSIAIYKYDGGWMEHQKLNAKSVLSIDVTVIESVIYLAVANNVPAVNCTNQALVYKLDLETKKFVPVVTVTTSYASSVLFVKSNGKHYLLVGHSIPYGRYLGFKDPLLVLLYDKGNFSIIHGVSIYDVVALEAFSLVGEHYVLAADSVAQCIHVLQWKGYSILEEIQVIHAYGIQNIAVYWANSSLHLAVASISNHSMILKAVTRGKQTYVLS